MSRIVTLLSVAIHRADLASAYPGTPAVPAISIPHQGAGPVLIVLVASSEVGLPPQPSGSAKPGKHLKPPESVTHPIPQAHHHGLLKDDALDELVRRGGWE